MAGFFVVDDLFIDGYARHLGAYGVGVYSVLRRHVDSKGSCFPSVALIAEKLGISGRQVRRAIKDLERWGIVSVSRSRGQGSRYHLFAKDKWIKTDYVELPPRVTDRADLVWPDGVPFADFPDHALTCEWGHSWEEPEGNAGRRCTYCGLLQAEDYYKRMCSPGERGVYFT